MPQNFRNSIIKESNIQEDKMAKSRNRPTEDLKTLSVNVINLHTHKEIKNNMENFITDFY